MKLVLLSFLLGCGSGLPGVDASVDQCPSKADFIDAITIAVGKECKHHPTQEARQKCGADVGGRVGGEWFEEYAHCESVQEMARDYLGGNLL